MCDVISYGIGCRLTDRHEHPNRIKLPTDQFIDLMEDSIKPWRLILDGFNTYPLHDSTLFELFLPRMLSVTICNGEVTIWNNADDYATLGVRMYGVTTYTQLLNLIDMAVGFGLKIRS
jgi:hypothetical protein